MFNNNLPESYGKNEEHKQHNEGDGASYCNIRRRICKTYHKNYISETMKVFSYLNFPA